MNAVVGTAGHIDHGKSMLVRALTGIDTDRLPQEKERGISIELGFAYMEGPGGERVGIIDVPGHERFIRQMLAGAQGFDLVLLVVAADDGVMPQTEEHFEIVHLLGITRGIFVITKCDLAEEGRIEEVRSELEVLAAGTPLEGSPVVAVSANDGRGLDELKAAIFDGIGDRPRGQHVGPFHMPVDRCFVLKGHGVVVTGTAASGAVAPGDNLEVLPGDREVRVREVHVHGRSVERAVAGQRVALNLVGLDREDIARGNTIASRGLEAETDRLEAQVEVRPAARRALASHDPIRLYMGTDNVRGRILWSDRASEVEPGHVAYGELRLERSTVAFAGQRFVLRDESAQRTIGGGMVLLPRAPRQPSGERAERLALLATGSVAERVEALLWLRPELGVSPLLLSPAARAEEKEVRALLAQGALLALPNAAEPALLVSAGRYRACVAALIDAVGSFHRSNASVAGIEVERLRVTLADRGWEVDGQSIKLVVDGLVGEGQLVRKGARLALPQHRSSLGEGDEELATRILAEIHKGASSPPTCKGLSTALSVEARKLNEILSVLAERGVLVRVSSELVFSADTVAGIEAELRGHLARHGEVSAAGFRDLISASRKYSIPLLDYFDSQGITMRSGDVRKLRPAARGTN